MRPLPPPRPEWASVAALALPLVSFLLVAARMPLYELASLSGALLGWAWAFVVRYAGRRDGADVSGPAPYRLTEATVRAWAHRSRSPALVIGAALFPFALLLVTRSAWPWPMWVAIPALAVLMLGALFGFAIGGILHLRGVGATEDDDALPAPAA